MNMKNYNDINVIKEYELLKYKYSIYALEHEWLKLLCSGIGQRSPAYCMILVAIIITIKYDKRE